MHKDLKRIASPFLTMLIRAIVDSLLAKAGLCPECTEKVSGQMRLFK